MSGKLCLIFIFLVAVLLSACSENESTDKTVDTDKASIVTVNYPLFYFTQQLADDLATVRLPVPAEIDPAQWNPQLDDVQQMQNARLVILNGAGYSTWLDKVALSPGKLVNSSLDARDRWISLSGETTHSHGPGGEHSHSGYAFSTWMDISLAKQQVNAIARALIRQWPDQQQAISQREIRLLEALTALDAGYRLEAQRLNGKFLIYSHPVYQYFEHRYQLAGHSLHWEPGEMPTDQQWRNLEKRLASQSNALFIWEDEPAVEITERLARMGLDSVVIRPAANAGNLDWLSEQQANLKRLQKIASVP
jgi:zinc transport system substrate-binding protein